MRSCICISRDAIARTGRDCIGCDAPAPAAFIDRADGPRVLLTSAGFGGIARGTGSRETPMPSSQPTTPPSQYTRAKNIKNSINQFEIPLQNQIRYLNHCIIGLKLSQCKNFVGIELGRTGHFAQSLRLSIRKLSGASDAGSRSKSTSQPDGPRPDKIRARLSQSPEFRPEFDEKCQDCVDSNLNAKIRHSLRLSFAVFFNVGW